MKKTVGLADFLLPSVVGVVTYRIAHRLFSGSNSKNLKNNKKGFKKDPVADLRSGGKLKRRIFFKIMAKVANDPALKIALVAMFTTTGALIFYEEILSFLAHDAFKKTCTLNAKGQLRVLCDVVEELGIKTLIIDENIPYEQKLNLLTIKLDYIINGSGPKKTRFVFLILFGIILMGTLSGISGLALILDALLRLFKEGKLSRATYEYLVITAKRNWTGNPESIEHWLELE